MKFAHFCTTISPGRPSTLCFSNVTEAEHLDQRAFWQLKWTSARQMSLPGLVTLIILIAGTLNVGRQSGIRLLLERLPRGPVLVIRLDHRAMIASTQAANGKACGFECSMTPSTLSAKPVARLPIGTIW